MKNKKLDLDKVAGGRAPLNASDAFIWKYNEKTNDWEVDKEATLEETGINLF